MDPFNWDQLQDLRQPDDQHDGAEDGSRRITAEQSQSKYLSRFVTARGLDEPLPVIEESSPAANAECRYYAAKTGALDLGSEMFRLCFTDDVLVSADHLYPAS